MPFQAKQNCFSSYFRKEGFSKGNSALSLETFKETVCDQEIITLTINFVGHSVAEPITDLGGTKKNTVGQC